MHNKTFLTITISLIIVLVIAIGVGGFILYKKGVFENAVTEEQTVQNEEILPMGELYNASIDDLVLNITTAKGRIKLMKFSFTLKSTEPIIEEMIQTNKEEIIDIVISQISQRNSEELLTIGGKELLKEELLIEVNRVINSWDNLYANMQKNNIKKILFTDFVMK